MSFFHGRNKKRSYFEGWYFRNQNESEVISFIPAFHIDERGKKLASIQVINNTDSDYITYSIDDFAISSNKFGIRIGQNIFTEEGIILNLKTERFEVKGKLYYDSCTVLKYDIMGPFQYVPFMQCRHSVYSLAHNIKGKLTVNGREISFHQGLGYMEGDRGREFPSDYLWTQCSWRSNDNNSIMISLADIPVGNTSFIGCIGIVYYEGVEHRLATYLGVKIKKYTEREVWLQQGKYDFRVTLIDENPQQLLAPVKGGMTRTVFESIDCKIRYRFMIHDKMIFDMIGRGSFERGIKEKG